MISDALPVGSLRGRPASLRTLPERACYRLLKLLIWRALLTIGPATSGPYRFFSLLSGRRILGLAPPQDRTTLSPFCASRVGYTRRSSGRRGAPATVAAAGGRRERRRGRRGR